MSDFEFNASLLIFLGLPVVALTLLWLGMLADVLIMKSDAWLLAGHDRWFSLLMVIGFGPIGAVIYLVFVRPRLARVEMRAAAEELKQPTKRAA